MTQEDPVVRFHNIRKRIGSRTLLDVDSLNIHRAQCVLVTGRNGAGKTTLLKILSGLEQPDYGEVEYGGIRSTWRAAARHLQRSVVYLHQFPYLFDASVTNNVIYGLRRMGVRPAQARERAEEALAWANLTHLGGCNARRLSGGEKQRIALMRAWVLNPRALLLDEPLASMDQEGRQQTALLIRRLKSEGVALVITGHDLHAMTPLVDKQLHLHDGKLLEQADSSARPPSLLPLRPILGTAALPIPQHT